LQIHGHTEHDRAALDARGIKRFAHGIEEPVDMLDREVARAGRRRERPQFELLHVPGGVRW
jgi:hypothetical protein